MTSIKDKTIMSYDGLVRLDQDVEQWRIMTAHIREVEVDGIMMNEWGLDN